MLDLTPLFDRLLPGDPFVASVVVIAVLALLVALMSLLIVGKAINRRGGR
jgi:hypothetical protein